ncbi:hypothetical protein [Amycolatopsis suaedae]|uniref:Uncharacterized protein n=1 Tax=Amycolatopsis suaedae TaxID=2510978 RepID=A0A4Q7J9Y1_9PSEU|nr:hypothetical protein [Amycolatopsis suaedae]RZQ64600.1 hypothetical protein EWH70_06755 [Amycolatopsis suaedae]
MSCVSLAPGGGQVRRPVSRAARRVEGVATFFGTDQLAKGDRALSVRTGHRSEDVFVEARFPRGRHHVHLRGAKNLPRSLAGVNAVSIHSGICLFSENTLRFWDENGGSPPLLRHLTRWPEAVRLSRITVDDEFSLYEYLTAAHLPHTIAEVAATLPASLPLTVVVEVPRVQYYGYLLDAVQRGLVDRELALNWFDLVDARHNRVAQLFRRNVWAELAAVGCADRARVFCPSPGLDLLADHIRRSVAGGTPVRHENLLDLLAGSGDPAWNLLLRLEPPATYPQLNDASYIVEVLRGARARDNLVRGLSIVVDSYEEFPRREHAQRVLDVLSEGALPALGIYSAERLLTADSRGRLDTPYLNGPGRHVVDEAGNVVDLFTLVDQLYGRA